MQYGSVRRDVRTVQKEFYSLLNYPAIHIRLQLGIHELEYVTVAYRLPDLTGEFTQLFPSFDTSRLTCQKMAYN